MRINLGQILRSRKLITVNLLALILIKGGFAHSGYQLATIIGDEPSFTKEEIIVETNAFRTSIGVAALKESNVLDIAAAQKLQDMKEHQYFAHVSPTVVTPWHWFENNRYSYTYAGENLAVGFLDAQSTVDAWIRSPSHRSNLASTYYQDIGVAVENTTIDDLKGMVVVQFFGAPGAAVSPKVNVGVGLSQTKAQESSVPSAGSEVPTIPPAAATVAPGVSPISSPGSVLPSPNVQTGQSRLSLKINQIARALNNTLMLYTLLVAMVSIVYLLFARARREALINAAAHTAILLLVVAIPLLEVYRTALIR